MEEIQNPDTKKIIAGLIVGTAVGAILGILFAPNKGNETRLKLTGTNKKLKTKLSNQLTEDKNVTISKSKRPRINTMIYD